MKYKIFLILLLLLAACKPAVKENVYYFSCSEGRSFSVEVNMDDVLLDDTLTLPRAVSASGAKYSDNRTTVWMKGNEAFIQEDGVTTYKDCVVD